MEHTWLEGSESQMWRTCLSTRAHVLINTITNLSEEKRKILQDEIEEDIARKRILHQKHVYRRAILKSAMSQGADSHERMEGQYRPI
jgi:hypothetical protein